MKAFAALVLAAMAGGALAPQPVRAQAAPAATAGRGVNVPAGPLGAALAGFAQQAKVLLSFDPALTEGIDRKSVV